jgi:hypothetical protein
MGNRWARATLVATTVLGACWFEQACSFEHGTLPVLPSDGGGSDTLPDAAQCTGASDMCLGDTWRHCDGSGATAIDTPCSWGCSTTQSAIAPTHCKVLQPSGGAATPLDTLGDPTLGDIELGADSVIEGDLGRIGTLTNAMLYRGNGGIGIMGGIDFQVQNSIAVFRFKSLKITGDLYLTGSRPIVLVVEGPVEITATIDARGNASDRVTGPCNSSLGGPGGHAGGTEQGGDATGSGAAQGTDTNNLGGGGGGYGGVGGAGGNGGQNGGPMFGDDTIMILTGGGGGAGGGGGGGAGSGAGGGGGLQITSNTKITIGATGGINAGGCGGENGNAGGDAGGGGGAGGSILLEAPAIEISGKLAVNGGAGGGGNNGANGWASPGLLDHVAAPGGPGNSLGGDGAFGANANGGTGDAAKGGGGGGAVGRIRLNTRDATLLMIMPGAVLSPAIADATTCKAGVATLAP